MKPGPTAEDPAISYATEPSSEPGKTVFSFGAAMLDYATVFAMHFKG